MNNVPSIEFQDNDDAHYSPTFAKGHSPLQHAKLKQTYAHQNHNITSLQDLYQVKDLEKGQQLIVQNDDELATTDQLSTRKDVMSQEFPNVHSQLQSGLLGTAVELPARSRVTLTSQELSRPYQKNTIGPSNQSKNQLEQIPSLALDIPTSQDESVIEMPQLEQVAKPSPKHIIQPATLDYVEDLPDGQVASIMFSQAATAEQAPQVLEAANPVQQNFEQGRKTLKPIFQMYLFLGFFYGMGLLVVNNQIPPQMLLGSLWAISLMQMAYYSLCYKSPPETNKRTFMIFDWFSIALYAMGATLHTKDVSFSLFSLTIPGYASALLYIFFGREEEGLLLRKPSIATLKMLFWTQVLLISLKMDGIIAAWTIVFSVLFYGLVFLMSVSIGFFILGCSYVCQSLHTGGFDYTAAGLFWDFINAMFSWVWGFIVLNLTDYLAAYQVPLMGPALIAGLAHVAVVCLYTKLLEGPIAHYLEAGASGASYVGDNPQARNLRYAFQTVKDKFMYLVRVSPTYFAGTEEAFKVRNRQQSKQWKHQILSSKMAKHRIKRVPNMNTHVEKKYSPSRRRAAPHNGSFCTAHIEMMNRRAAQEESGMDRHDVSRVCYSENDIDIIGDVIRPAMADEEDKRHNSMMGEKECIICFTNPSDAVFMDCGHSGVCYECALEVWKKGDSCLLCRQPIKEILQVTMMKGGNLAKVVKGTTKSSILI